MKKYELDKNDSIKVKEHTLYRVIYTDEFVEKYKEIYDVTIDKKGGYIESEDNLSQDGYALILDGSRVMTGHARVTGHTEVTCNAVVSDYAAVSGYARVINNAVVSGHARVSGCSWVRDNVQIDKDTMIVNVVISEEVK